jgi:arylsulfatase A-like enzyme
LSLKNLLLISIEDLNDWVEPLGGHPDAITPNIRRLADIGAVFKSAYAAAPACSPSRNATLFSKFPWETGLYANENRWSDHFPYGERLSLIGHLRDAGMATYGCGKVFHSSYRGNQEEKILDKHDWTEFYFAPKVKYPPISRSAKSGDLPSNADFGPDPTGLPSYDDLNADWIVDKIQPGMESHVWAVGIYRPHLPFIAPPEYFDLIPEVVSLPPGLGMNEFDPTNLETFSRLPKPARSLVEKQSKTGKILHRHGEFNDFLRAYLAAIAYADAKLGAILDRLEECRLTDDTLIVLWSDHGWQLGEKLAFRKFTLWERALRVPVIVGGAGLTKSVISDPISLVDLAPTILSLLGLEPNEEYSGQDLSPAIHGTGELARPFAPSVWGTGFRSKLKLAYSIRSKRYRLTKYWNNDFELFDHQTDPYEHANLAQTDYFKDGDNLPEQVRLMKSSIKGLQIVSAPPKWHKQMMVDNDDVENTDDDEVEMDATPDSRTSRAT